MQLSLDNDNIYPHYDFEEIPEVFDYDLRDAVIWALKSLNNKDVHLQ